MRYLILLLLPLLAACGPARSQQREMPDALEVTLYKRVAGDVVQYQAAAYDLTEVEKSNLKALAEKEGVLPDSFEDTLQTDFCFAYPYDTKTRQLGEPSEVPMFDCEKAQLIKRSSASELFDLVAEDVYGQDVS